MRNLRIKHRLWGLVLIVIAGNIGTVTVALSQLNSTLMDDKQHQTRNLAGELRTVVARFKV